MQDIQAIGGAAAGGGGGGSLFVTGNGDRRLRPHTHSSQNNQAVKCPRCDSSNTKFCYYNNYNLSQPRHFCKNCRRYWTKGGVLRNVPVGGGCRKAKRTKPKQTEDSPVANNTELDSNSNSSSESSSLTATNAPVKMSTEVASATEKSSNSPKKLLNFPQPSRFFLDQHQPSIFPESGSFTSLMTLPPPVDSSSLLGFNFTDVSAYRMQQNQNCTPLVEDHPSSNHTMLTRGDEEFKMDQINYGYLDPTANIGFNPLQQSRVTMGGLAGLDWQINGEDGGGGGKGTDQDQDQGLFDFVEADQAYLSQNNWLDNDASFNFPPLV